MAELRQIANGTADKLKQQDKDKLDESHNDDGKVHLKREIGLFAATMMVIGNTIGVGIFISPKGVLLYTQSVGMCLVVWLLCGVISLFGSLCYAELGAMLPQSGGEYVFFNAAFGPATAFLFSWTVNLIIRPSGLAIVTLSIADYAVAPFFEGADCKPPDSSYKLVAILCILMLATVSAYSVKLSSYLINFFAVAKTVALGIIITVGAIRLGQGYTEYLDPKVSFEGTSSDVLAYGFAFYQGLFPYDGWNTLPYITEELKNPTRNLPLAIIIGINFVIVVFMFTNVAYFTAMSPEELLQSDAVAVTFGVRTLGTMFWLMPLGVVCSIFGVVCTGLLFSARLPYVAAREGHMPEILAMAHVRRYTPLPAIVFFVTGVIIMILPGSIDTLMNYFSFVNWLVYGSAFFSLIWLRFKHPEWKRPIKIPLIIPISVVLSSLFLVVAPIIDDPSVEFLYAALFILAGLIAYFPLVYFGYRFPFMDKLTLFLQMLFEVAPSGYNVDKMT